MTQKLILLFLTICFLVSCSQTDRKIQSEKITKFENHLGLEKTRILNEIVNVLDRKLQEKYGCNSNLTDCYLYFLKDIKNQIDISSVYSLSDYEKSYLKAKIDSCGIRKEIWLYGFEPEFNEAFIDSSLFENRNDSTKSLGKLTYLEIDEEIDSVELTDSMNNEYFSISDSVITYNIHGSFLTGLELIQENDSLIIEYVNANKKFGSISPNMLANGLLFGFEKFGLSEYFLKRIVVAEFYILYLDK